MAVIQGTGRYQGPGGFDRGMQSTMHCGSNPESWVRGSASLDTTSGDISVTIQLETDSTTAGPKGKVKIFVKDAVGATIATVESAEIGMWGRPPGRAVQRNFASSVAVPADIAQRAASLWVEAQCAGSIGQLWGIDLASVARAFQLFVSVVA